MNRVLSESEFRHVDMLQSNLYFVEAADLLEGYANKAIEAGDSWFVTIYYQFHLYARLPGYSTSLVNFLEKSIAHSPDTAFQINALKLYADLQNALGNSTKVIETCKNILRINDQDYEALYLLVINEGDTENHSMYKRLWRKRNKPEHMALGFALYEIFERNSDPNTEKILLEANAFMYRHIKALPRPRFTPLQAEKRVTANQDMPVIKPIFVMGLPRSGSTLVERQLASFDGVLSLGECNFLKISAGYANADIFFSKNPQLEAQDYRRIYNAYQNQIHFRRHTKPIVTDKSLNNLAVLSLLPEIFDDFTAIVCYRNPASNALSIFRKKFEGDYLYAYNLESLCKHVASTHAQINKYQELFSQDKRIHFLDLDHYVHNPDNKNKLVSAVLDENIRKTAQAPADDLILTASATQARKPMSPDNIHQGELLNGVRRTIEKLLS